MDEQTQATIPPKATPTPLVTAPGVPRPITVRLRPIAPVAGGTQTPLSPITPTTAGDAATVRLRPVNLSPSTTAPIMAQMPAISTSQINATLQAAKSKTSRISLDSAMGVTTSIPIAQPADKNNPKTIRLKRPTDLESPVTAPTSPISSPHLSMTAAIITPPGIKLGAPTSPSKTSTIPSHKTSRIPDSVIPADSPLTPQPGAAPTPTANSSTVTQKKTLKIRRAGAPEPTSVSTGSTEAATGSSLEGVTLTPISEIEVQGISKGYKIFTIFAISFASIAAILMIVLNWCLAADVIAPFATKNTAASIQLDAQLPWPGKLDEYK